MANNKDFVINNPIDVSGSAIETRSGFTTSTSTAFNPALKEWDMGYNRPIFDLTEGGSYSTNPGVSGMTFKPDGTMMFAVFQGDDRVWQYDLSTPWDITTAVRRTGTGDELWLGATNNSPRALSFSPDGGSLFVLNVSSTNRIERHDLTTNWDLSTASASFSSTLSVADSSPTAFCFNSDGSKCYVVGNNNGTVYTYACNAGPFIPTNGGGRISAETYDLTNTIASMVSPQGIFLSPDDNYMYVSESQYLYRYQLLQPGNVEHAIWLDRTEPFSTDTQGQTRFIDFYLNSSLGKVYTADSTQEVFTEINVNTIVTESNNIDLSAGNYFKVSPSHYNDTAVIAFNNPSSVQAFQVEVEGTGFTWDVENMTLVAGQELEFTSEPDMSPSYAASAQNLEHLYVGGSAQTGSTIYHYRLSTPGDLSTGNLVSTELVQIDGNSNANPEALYMKPDGTKMWISQRMVTGTYTGQDVISEFDLTVAYQISTVDLASEVVHVVGIQQPRGIDFKPDGTRVFWTSGAGSSKHIYSYDLTTPWDLSTKTNFRLFLLEADATGNYVGTQHPYPGTLHMQADGKGYTFTSTQTGYHVYKMKMATPWDITTSYFDTAYTTSYWAEGACVSDNGDTMLLAWNTSPTDKFVKWNMASPHTIQWPSNVKWSRGYTPAGPAAGEKAIYTFVTQDGGATYIGAEITDSTS